MNDAEAKSEILEFITNNSGQYYKVETKITSNGARTPYRVVKS